MQWSYSGDVVLTTDASRALQLLDIRCSCCIRRSLLLRRRGSPWHAATKRSARYALHTKTWYFLCTLAAPVPRCINRKQSGLLSTVVPPKRKRYSSASWLLLVDPQLDLRRLTFALPGGRRIDRPRRPLNSLPVVTQIDLCMLQTITLF